MEFLLSRFRSPHSLKKFRFLTAARGLYGEAFGLTQPAELSESMSDWTELSPEERSFVAAHLSYLAVEAEAATQSLLEDLRDGLEDLEVVVDRVAVSLASSVGAARRDSSAVVEEDDADPEVADVKA